MTELMQFTVGGRDSVMVEVDSPTYLDGNAGIGPAGRGGRSDLPATFAAHLQSVREAATAALDVFRSSMSPDEVRLSFGVKFTAEAGAVIARTALEGNLGVELVWHRAEDTEIGS
jgi:hypothetical protein